MLKHENMQIIFYQNLYLFVPFCTHALPLGEAKHKPPNCTIQYENVVVPRGYFFAVLFVAISVAILCVSWLFLLRGYFFSRAWLSSWLFSNISWLISWPWLFFAVRGYFPRGYFSGICKKTIVYHRKNSRAPRGYFFAWLFLRRENAAKTFEKIAVQNVAILYGRGMRGVINNFVAICSRVHWMRFGS